MGTVSLNNSSRLFWLGRYTERVYTGLKEAKFIYDAYVDGQEADFAAYCHALGISASYTNTADFCRRYYFDEQDSNSLISSLRYAYDNAVVMRDTLSSVTLSYIQLAFNAMQDAAKSTSPAILLQLVMDDIMAFRGSCEESIAESACRATLKMGANLERVDLYLRLGKKSDSIRQVFELLFNRLYRTGIAPDATCLGVLIDSLLDSSKPNRAPGELISALEKLFPDL